MKNEHCQKDPIANKIKNKSNNRIKIDMLTDTYMTAHFPGLVQAFQ